LVRGRVVTGIARPLVGVVADDITGAGDIAGLFASRGYAARVFTADANLEAIAVRVREARTDVVVVDTDSRLVAPEIAAHRVRRVTRALEAAGCTFFWKKTCSVFRGNVGQEFDAMLEVLNEPFGVAVAAFPKNGRTTLNGVHFVRGVPLSESEFRLDPVHPRLTSSLVETVSAQTARRVVSIPLETVRSAGLHDALLERKRSGVGYAILDAQTQADLQRIARSVAGERLVLGSSALAEELPTVWAPPEPFDALRGLRLEGHRGVVAVAASVMPQTRSQLEAFEAVGGAVLVLDSRRALESFDVEASTLALEASRLLEAGGDVVVRSDNTPNGVSEARAFGATLGLSDLDVSRRISSLLARVARLTLERTGTRRLVALGGDTSAAICRELGVHEMVVLHEIAPGLPSSLVVGPQSLLVVLKSGSFGGRTFLLEAMAHLRGLGSAG
jgi:uncharacterized protein YgbK (DUF1537 family)